MKLRNKKTGKIGWLYCDHISVPKKMTVFSEEKDLSANHWDYNSLAEVNEEWEDYEEPKDFWFIDDEGDVQVEGESYEENLDKMKEIGNYFETKEEAEKAVKRLRAWKRLKDIGCTLILDDHFAVKFVGPDATRITSAEEQKSLSDDYKLLFGGEE